MADHGFYRTDGALSGRPLRFAPEGSQAVQFRDVSHPRPCAVAFNEINGVRGPSGRLISGAHGANLAFCFRRKKIASHVVGESDAANQPVNCVPVTQCIIQSFENNHPRAFSHHKTIRVFIKRSASARWRECAQLAETDLSIKAFRSGDSSGQHGICTACMEFVACEFHSIKRRGACCIKRKTSASESKSLGQNRPRKTRHPATQTLFSADPDF